MDIQAYYEKNVEVEDIYNNKIKGFVEYYFTAEQNGIDEDSIVIKTPEERIEVTNGEIKAIKELII